MDSLSPNQRLAKQLQQEEYEVIESIYPGYLSGNIMEGSLKLEVVVEFNEPRTVLITEDGTLSSDGVYSELSLSALPSIILNLDLPATYPVDQAPDLVSIRATHVWIPQTTQLYTRLVEMWRPGEGVLYDWIEYLRDGSFLQVMGVTSDGNDDVIRLSHPAPRLLVPLLKAFDQTTRSTHFAQSTYPCSICLSSHKGTKCLQLSCEHVFCRECVEDFWRMCITEGEVGRVGCPDPSCVKASREANEGEVARVVSEAEVQRWRWLREKRDLERDPSIVHCPMAFCQVPVTRPAGTETGSGWDRLRSCSNCSFSFCVFCKRTWHGPITPCPIAHAEKVVLEYLALPMDSPERDVIERRFGKSNMQRLVAAYEEEQLNRQWLKSSTMACPGCQVNVEKSLGCNHMTCAKCRQHFCYRCGEKLEASNPYAHFSTKGIPCYNKLFDFSSEEQEWEMMEGMEIL